MLPKIYILLPVHNRLAATLRFVENLRAQTYAHYHLVLIDDGSTDGTADMVAQRVSSLTVIRGKGDWWWAGSLHQGYVWLRKSRVDPEDLVLIMNHDSEFGENFFQKAVDLIAGRQRVLLGARTFSKRSGVLVDKGVHIDWEKFVHYQADDERPINCLSTRGLFFRVKDFFVIGDFHPILLPHYTSDYEFTIRAHRKGYTLMTHEGVALTDDESTTGDHDWFQEKNLFCFLKRSFSKRVAGNPVFLFSYVALACPWPWKGKNLFRVIKGFVLVLLKRVKSY